VTTMAVKVKPFNGLLLDPMITIRYPETAEEKNPRMN
jgi:hypothetical protein